LFPNFSTEEERGDDDVEGMMMDVWGTVMFETRNGDYS